MTPALTLLMGKSLPDDEDAELRDDYSAFLAPAGHPEAFRNSLRRNIAVTDRRLEASPSRSRKPSRSPGARSTPAQHPQQHRTKKNPGPENRRTPRPPYPAGTIPPYAPASPCPTISSGLTYLLNVASSTPEASAACRSVSFRSMAR